jgi:hypothetical protein
LLRKSVTMIRICFLLLFFCTAAKAQDFSLNDLIRLRSMNLSSFETEVLAKGYNFTDVIKDLDQFIVFKKEDNVIMYGLIKNPRSQSTDTVVIYRTLLMDEYKTLMGQRKKDPAHEDITHFFNDGKTILHSYIDGKAAAHFRTRYANRTYYEVKILPDNTDKYYQYATLNGDIYW